MESERSVSVAMATYNGAPFIREQLDSLAEQTLIPAELVVCDDQSTDGTPEIVRAFARTAPFPVRLTINAERLGPSDNFFKATSLCGSPLIALADQDDVWLPSKLEACVSRLAADDSLMALHTSTIVDRTLRPIGELKQGIRGDAVLEPLSLHPYDGFGWGHTLVFRKDLLTRLPTEQRPMTPGGDKRLSHDVWFYVLAAGLGRVSHVDKALVLYRQHGGNVAGAAPLTLLEKLAWAMTVPIYRYREHLQFYSEAQACFEAIEGEPAKAAAADYARMVELMETRVAMHTARNPAKRVSHLLAFARLGGGASSCLKDFFLGVLRLGRVLEAKP